MSNWKERLGIESESNYVFNFEIDNHLLELGFYYSEMNPRFMNGNNYDDLTLNAKVLRFDGNHPDDDGGVQRVFMNKNEIYVERQTNYRSYDGSNYRDLSVIDEPLSFELLNSILDEIVQ